MFTRLNSGWNTITSRQTTAQQQTSQVSVSRLDEAEEEITEDKVLSDLTRDYVELIKIFLGTNSPPDDPNGDEIPTPIFIHFLSSQTTEVWERGIQYMIYTLIGGLVWPDSVAFNRCVSLCGRIFSVLIKNCQDLRVIVVEMLKKSLEALFNAHPQAETISHLITLIWTIYQKLIVHPQYQQSLETLFLSAVPKLSSIALNDLNKSLQRESNEKKKRTLFKKMLSPIIGASKQHLTARPLINNISHEFHIPKTKPTMSDQDGIIDLGSLFSNNSGDNNS